MMSVSEMGPFSAGGRERRAHTRPRDAFRCSVTLLATGSVVFGGAQDGLVTLSTLHIRQVEQAHDASAGRVCEAAI